MNPVAVLQRGRAVLARVKWARAIRAADLVDLDYVAAQLGRRVSARSAVLRYVWRGFQSGFRLNPLFVDETVGDHLPGLFRVPALFAYVVADPTGIATSPLWDAAGYLERHPERRAEPGGAVGAAWRRRREEGMPFGTGAHPLPADDLDGRLATAAAQARDGESASIGASTGSPDIELVIAIDDGETDFDESLFEAAAFADAGGAVALAVAARRPEIWAQVTMLASGRPGIRAVYRPGRPAEESLAELVGSTPAPTVVVRGSDLTMSADQMRALAERASGRTVVAPVWLDVDGTIAAVGTAREGGILAGHPAEDASALGGGRSVIVPSLAVPLFAAPADLAREVLRSGSPLGVFAAFARERRIGLEIALDLETRSRVRASAPLDLTATEDVGVLLGAAGWETVTAGPLPRVRRRTRRVVLDDGREIPGLRWALRTAAPPGERGEAWGDTHFARGLAAALRRLGQEVVVDAYPARDRPTAHLDDVTLVLRGPEPIDPPETGINVLWIISHPDEVVAPGDVAGFDLVFAASAGWAERSSLRLGREVAPLLQCTDPSRFHPTGRARGDRIVFVGTARGLYRPSIVDPVRAGVPVDVYGPDWREWIPASRIRGTGIPNRDLPSVYETAAVVLNDHWPAMQREGFIGNRLYDVVAAGGRVISDHVDGVEDAFEGAVVSYRSTAELIEFLSGDLDRLFPAEDVLRGIGTRIREQDSFDARAGALLDRVLNAR